MSSWNEGYITEFNYSTTYFKELNPLEIELALINAGVSPPKISVACELGFGQGISTNIHAAASTRQWLGTDFNPSQASFARDTARSAGLNVSLFDDSFSEFLLRDLPDFDFIGLHGIWSWISSENRKYILDFAKRKLNVGGVLYVSYNTLPGHAQTAPIVHLMHQFESLQGRKSSPNSSMVMDTLGLIDKFIETDPLFFKASILAKDKINQIKAQDPVYLAHEYFGSHWHPMYFSDVCDNFESAKISYVCSSEYLKNLDEANLTNAQRAYLSELKSPLIREQIRDFLVNRQFRRDYFIKGVNRLTALARKEHLRERQFLLVKHPSDISLKIKTLLSDDAVLLESTYSPIFHYLSDHKIRSFSEIENSVSSAGITFEQLVQAIMILCERGDLSVAQNEQMIKESRGACDRLNSILMAYSRASSDFLYLASPVTGGGILTPRFHQLFLLARQQGQKTPEQWAKFTWEILSAQGQRLIKEGKTLETPEENLNELTAQSKEFSDKRLPILQALQIA